MEYCSDTYNKFMQGADTFDDEDEDYLNKLSKSYCSVMVKNWGGVLDGGVLSFLFDFFYNFLNVRDSFLKIKPVISYSSSSCSKPVSCFFC